MNVTTGNLLTKLPIGDEPSLDSVKKVAGDILTGVTETAMITLWARAAEDLQPLPLFHDAKAANMVDSIDYDFRKFKNSWKTQTSVAIRTWILDREISDYINKNPNAVIINLGAGLDDRFTRLDNGTIIWIDIDLPAVIELKKSFFEETDRYRFVEKSILDFSWLDAIKAKNHPVLFIAEGLLMYLDASEIITLFDKLSGHYAGAQMLIELLAPAAAGGNFQDSDNIMNIGFKWSVLNSRYLEAMHNKVQVVDEWCVLDFFRYRWRWIGRCADVPMFRNYFGEKIVHLEIK